MLQWILNIQLLKFIQDHPITKLDVFKYRRILWAYSCLLVLVAF